MHFIEIPTEQTTAITDILLAVAAALFIFLIRANSNKSDSKKTLIWSVAFGFLAVAAALGAIAHGIKMTKELNALIWHPINLCLGLTVAFFTAGVIYDINRFNIAGYVLVLLIISSLLFFIVTLIIPGSFLIFILYEALAMIFALVSYLILAFRGKLRGAWLMSGGILISVLASVIQAMGTFQITLIWEFDYNGLFHILQILGLLFLSAGLNIEIKSRKTIR